MHTCRSAAGAATLDGYAYVIGMLNSRIGSVMFVFTVIHSWQGLGEISMICFVIPESIPFPDVARYIHHKT